MAEFLWYIPNTIRPGHRGDDTAEGWGSLDYSVELAQVAQHQGWSGALIGAGWGRPDSFTLATAIAARTPAFTPLVAIRAGYWQPAHFAASAATLDVLTSGRLAVNVVTGLDEPAAYGDGEFDPARRYARTREFLQLVRRLWTETEVSFAGEFYRVERSRLQPRPFQAELGRHPRLYFGGASPEAEAVAAAEADVQLFWGEPLDGVAERIERLTALGERLGRAHVPLEYGLRVTTVVRETSDEAWAAAEAKIEQMAVTARAEGTTDELRVFSHAGSVGQQRLLDLVSRGEVLDSNLLTTPGKYGGGGAGTTWLVGSAVEVADSLRRYADLGVTHFVLSDTPYIGEAARVGDTLLPLARAW